METALAASYPASKGQRVLQAAPYRSDAELHVRRTPWFKISVKEESGWRLTVGQRVDDGGVEGVSGSQSVEQTLRRKRVGMNQDPIRTQSVCAFFCPGTYQDSPGQAHSREA